MARRLPEMCDVIDPQVSAALDAGGNPALDGCAMRLGAGDGGGGHALTGAQGRGQRRIVRRFNGCLQPAVLLGQCAQRRQLVSPDQAAARSRTSACRYWNISILLGPIGAPFASKSSQGSPLGPGCFEMPGTPVPAAWCRGGGGRYMPTPPLLPPGLGGLMTPIADIKPDPAGRARTTALRTASPFYFRLAADAVATGRNKVRGAPGSATKPWCR